MQLNYNYLKNKYLNYFEGNEESCNLILTDVIFGFNEISEIIKISEIMTILFLQATGKPRQCGKSLGTHSNSNSREIYCSSYCGELVFLWCRCRL